MLYFATLFDSNYLYKGLSLYASLKQHVKDFKLFVLCLDDTTFEYFRKASYQNIQPIRLGDLEDKDEELLAAKGNRGIVEYYFTLSPVLPLYILTNFKEVDFITTMDADIFLFNDPMPVYKEFEGNSILITPHRFPAKLEDRTIYGFYNVSFQIFRSDVNGLECLRWWRSKCIEWCYDKLEGNRFADQKYLDDWPTRFKGVAVLQHEGAGIAPWNINNYEITKRDGIIYSNNSPLIFYHFHYLKAINNRWFSHAVDLYSSRMTRPLKNFLYHPYINKLVELNNQFKISGLNANLRNSKYRTISILEILRTYSTLFNIISLYTIEINVKRYLKYSYKLLRAIKRI